MKRWSGKRLETKKMRNKTVKELIDDVRVAHNPASCSSNDGVNSRTLVTLDARDVLRHFLSW